MPFPTNAVMGNITWSWYFCKRRCQADAPAGGRAFAGVAGVAGSFLGSALQAWKIYQLVQSCSDSQIDDNESRLFPKTQFLPRGLAGKYGIWAEEILGCIIQAECRVSGHPDTVCLSLVSARAMGRCFLAGLPFLGSIPTPGASHPHFRQTLRWAR